MSESVLMTVAAALRRGEPVDLTTDEGKAFATLHPVPGRKAHLVIKDRMVAELPLSAFDGRIRDPHLDAAAQAAAGGGTVEFWTAHEKVCSVTPPTSDSDQEGAPHKARISVDDVVIAEFLVDGVTYQRLKED